MHVDKKIKDLHKGCHLIELITPTHGQINTIIETIMPCISELSRSNIILFVQGDLRVLRNIYEIYLTSPELIEKNMMDSLFQFKTYNNATKNIAKDLLNTKYSITDHPDVINDTDRTTVSLYWHENIIDVLDSNNMRDSIFFYMEQLDNICFADYLNRVTFQKQIWQFNEMSSLIKTFKNNAHYHNSFLKTNTNKTKFVHNNTEVRFTKVLTKYATEYNNINFIQKLCQTLHMDKKDVHSFFTYMQNKGMPAHIEVDLLEMHEIRRLDINRVYKYLDHYTKVNPVDDDNISSSRLTKYQSQPTLEI
jgi:hypothetical protein